MNEKTDDRLQLRIVSIEELACDIKSFELVNETRTELPSFAAGAHIEVFLPQSLKRHYSICSDPHDRLHYVIAVLRQENGTGGSKYMHDRLRVGDQIEASAPRNNFPLIEKADRYTLIAGGIGITPILPMVSVLRQRNAEFVLHYCARFRGGTAFVDLLSALCDTGQLMVHFDAGDPKKSLNVNRLLNQSQPGTQVYCCGPVGLMRAVREATAAWPEDSVHFEYFSAVDAGIAKSDDTAFDIIVRSRLLRLRVPAERSIVQVLRENGVDVETSCEAGTCGTCRTRYLSGQPIHNDFVLSNPERGKYVMICCARAQGGPLELDL